MAKLHYRSYNPNQIILFPQRKVLLEQVDEAIAQDKCNVDEKNKENSQLKCISLKLRVLIYIEGVVELLTHPLFSSIKSNQLTVIYSRPLIPILTQKATSPSASLRNE